MQCKHKSVDYHSFYSSFVEEKQSNCNRLALIFGKRKDRNNDTSNWDNCVVAIDDVLKD